VHPSDALFEPGEPQPRPLPVCDHYAGVEARMRKALALQGELGPVFDLTLDAEDGAPVGGELEHASLIADLVNSAGNRHDRVGARVHPAAHPAFERELEVLVPKAGAKLAYLMLPKAEGVADVERACQAIDRLAASHGVKRHIPVHVLIETHGGLRDVQSIAAHTRVESLSFGLMDFVSAHRGAIPRSAMGMPGQFEHPLVCRAKLEIAAACHAAGKVPSHNVVTEFKDQAVLADAVRRAARQFGFTRMWSIHPDQIRNIVDGFAPDPEDIAVAGEVLLAAQAAGWAPVSHRQTLHDRASYRYFWQVLVQAHKTARLTDATVQAAFFR
jgi:citrate lyase subunit beta / citryl-CoA lyase